MILTIAQSAAGLFFALSGYHKLFNADRHKSLVKTLEDDHVPLVKVNQWWVPLVEMVGGTCLAMQFAPKIAAALLLVICFVACTLDGRKRVNAWQPIDLADRVDDWLYLPEVLLSLILMTVFAN